jgi:pimeloyl-ACP methyl ester carboxylesterase
MATFILVHGAWHGGWCWKRVAARLRQAGHEVFTPTLTGLGDRSHLMSASINLDTHVQDILGLLRWEELTDVVLCAHSYGGMVITAAADRVPDTIRSLVYLDAVVPDDGKSLLDFVPADAAAAYRHEARTIGEGFRLAPIPAEIYNVNNHDRAWIDRRCTDHSINCFEQKVHLSGAWMAVANRVYVHAAGWARASVRQFYERFRHDPGWRVLSLPCGHDVMIDMPQEVTEILIDSVH